MKVISTLFVVSILFLGSVELGFGQKKKSDDAEMKALTKVLDKYEKDTMSGNFKGLVQSPPKILESLAGQADMDAKDFLEKMAEMMSKAFESIEVLSFSMDKDSVKLQRTNTGRPYAVIPNAMKINVKGTGGMEMKTETLALKDDGVWYLMQVDSEEVVDMLKKAYPDLKDIKVAKTVMKKVDEKKIGDKKVEE